MLYVFSSNASPFEPNKAYNRFAVYAILNHGGDFKQAAADLSHQGYGEQRRRRKAVRVEQDDREVVEVPAGHEIGGVTLRPGLPRRTGSGRITLSVAVLRDGVMLDQVPLSNTDGGRRAAARTLAAHFAGEAPKPTEVQLLLARIIAAAAQELDHGPPVAALNLRDVVRTIVPTALQIVGRTDKGLWSDAKDGELTRADLIAFTPERLLKAAAAAADAPQSPAGMNRGMLLGALRDELTVLYANLIETEPLISAANLTRDMRFSMRFRANLVSLWTKPKTFELLKPGDGDVRTASKTSLARRARDVATGVRESSRGWREVQRAHHAYWRAVVTNEGEVTLYLGMRWELAGEIEVMLPGVINQDSLQALAKKAGCLNPDPPVTDRLSGGHRLIVLSDDLRDEILIAAPERDIEESVTTNGGCHSAD